MGKGMSAILGRNTRGIKTDHIVSPDDRRADISVGEKFGESVSSVSAWNDVDRMRASDLPGILRPTNEESPGVNGL
jgi:hypothetical protein